MKSVGIEENHLHKLLQLPSVTQIGIVVPDLEKAIAYYRDNFYIGPFKRIPSFQKLGYHETFYKGAPEKFDSSFAFSRLGNMELEIIQPLSGRSIYRDFLEAGRKGLHHLGFDVYENYDQRLEAYAGIGIEVIQSARGHNRAVAYLDTEKIGGVIFELIKRGGPRKMPKGC